MGISDITRFQTCTQYNSELCSTYTSSKFRNVTKTQVLPHSLNQYEMQWDYDYSTVIVHMYIPLRLTFTIVFLAVMNFVARLFTAEIGGYIIMMSSLSRHTQIRTYWALECCTPGYSEPANENTRE